MEIIKNYEVPTGNILIVEGSKGKLEVLSLGDYGKDKNIKADFLGYTDEIEGVPHGELQPLTEKWVVTLSPQYGCSMNCRFCDVPKVGPGKNATLRDMQRQIITALQLHPDITHTERLNIHFARMGEPSFNPDVLDCGKWIKEHIDPEYNTHPVVSTMMPKNHKWLKTFIHTWIRIKNRVFRGSAGLQLSINSTDEEEREKMFGGSALSIPEIGKVMDGSIPVGRKFTLNFALADYTIDPDVLLRYFSPEDYICKLTPMHVTKSCEDNEILTEDGYDSFYPYRETEEALKEAGYDVIVFVPSYEEDEGRITCGNAILSGTEPKEYQNGDT